MWYDAPRNSVKKFYQRQASGAIIISTTPRAMTHLSVPDTMRKHAAKMLHSLVNSLPENERRVFVNKSAPGGTTKYSWFVVTAAGIRALGDAARMTNPNELNSIIQLDEQNSRRSKREAVHRELREQGLDECPTCHMYVPDPDDPHYAERVEAINHLGQCECTHLEQCRCAPPN